MIDAFWTRWEQIMMQILEDHMSSLSFSTNEARELKKKKTEIIVCILLTSNHIYLFISFQIALKIMWTTLVLTYQRSSFIMYFRICVY